MQRLILRCYCLPRWEYYKILGVPRSATAPEIKKAYYTLAKHYHPDITGFNEAATKKFIAVKEAYDVLKDSKKREHYDFVEELLTGAEMFQEEICNELRRERRRKYLKRFIIFVFIIGILQWMWSSPNKPVLVEETQTHDPEKAVASSSSRFNSNSISPSDRLQEMIYQPQSNSSMPDDSQYPLDTW